MDESMEQDATNGQLMRQMMQMQIHDSTSSAQFYPSSSSTLSSSIQPSIAPIRPRSPSDSGFGSDKEEQMEGDFEEEINVQITLQVQAAHLPSHLQQEQPLQLHQQERQEHANQTPSEQHSSSSSSSSSSFSLPCQDQHFTTYPQLLKRAQLIPMQNHNLI